MREAEAIIETCLLDNFVGSLDQLATDGLSLGKKETLKVVLPSDAFTPKDFLASQLRTYRSFSPFQSTWGVGKGGKLMTNLARFAMYYRLWFNPSCDGHLAHSSKPSSGPSLTTSDVGIEETLTLQRLR